MFTALYTKVNHYKDSRWKLVQLCPDVKASYLMSCCAIAWSMFLSNMLSINFIHTGQRNTALPLLKKVQLNALGLIRLVIMLHDDWILAFFRRRRRQLSHLHLSKPILKKKKSRKQQNQSALSRYLQFSHLMVFELYLFFLFLFFFQKSDHVFRNASLHTTSATHVGNTLIILLNHSHFDYVMFPMI